QDGRFSMQMETKVVDMRLATLPTVWGYEGAVIRILDRSDDIATLESLGLERSEFERFTRMLASPHGAIFATGPTGSGKTTTLYASLARVATPEVKVLTVEDPVEMRIPNITQV